MARRPYVHLAGDLSTWPKGFTPTPAHMRKLDQFSSELVNGEDGGTFNPTDPIVVGPWTTPNITLSTAGSVLSGDVETVAGNSRDATLDVPGIVLQGGNPPICVTARTRSVTVSFVDGIVTTDVGSGTAWSAWDVDPVSRSMRAIIASSAEMLLLPLPFRAQHRGSTIDSVTFRYAIAQERVALPNLSKPWFGVFRGGATAPTFLHTAAGAYNASGFYVDAAATVADYFSNGQTRTAVFTPNQNNTSLDPSAYYYFLAIFDETGTAGTALAGNRFMSATVALSAIADLRQE